MANDTLAFLEKFKGDFETMRQAAPDLVKGFGGMFLHIMRDGALKRKDKELVALGIAVAQCCEPCITLHVQKCLEAGNSAPEILDAAAVAVTMQGGPAYMHIPVVLDALAALAPKS
jgi:AhpD family alkylhydroperoxidase